MNGLKECMSTDLSSCMSGCVALKDWVMICLVALFCHRWIGMAQASTIATWLPLHIQGGLVKSLAILSLDKQASFLHSATTRPPGTNYSISFLATRGHWNVFLCLPPPPPAIPNPPKWLIEEGGSGHQKGKKVVFNHINPRRDQECMCLVGGLKKTIWNWSHKETPTRCFRLLAH